jgi:hypothetical protein
MPQRLMTVPNEFVADMIRQRLSDGGIQSTAAPSGGKGATVAFGIERAIYVEDTDLERARAIVQEAEAAGRDLGAADEG